MLRLGLTAVIAALAVATTASAGGVRSGSIKDAPSDYRSPLWEGFYVGANAGYGWAEDNGGNVEVFDQSGQMYAHGPLNYGLELGGAFVGFQAGLNRRAG